MAAAKMLFFQMDLIWCSGSDMRRNGVVLTFHMKPCFNSSNTISAFEHYKKASLHPTSLAAPLL